MGEIGLVQLLLKHGAKVDIRDSEGNTPLLLAARNGHEKLVEFLVGNGTDPHVRGEKGRTLMHLAVKGVRPGLVTLCLHYKVNVDIKDDEAPLHEAALKASQTFVNMLLENRANPCLGNNAEQRPSAVCWDEEIKARLVEAEKAWKEKPRPANGLQDPAPKFS